ncbi:hypothetical protein A1O7_03486 [Cladophialophora yegresii CBS 114405]|uniref:Uncharacterized protein n=1 Tax=Cladophialophora yegresii CBS 114405 TaxID=1182544 RepID=W9WEN7_9EURO|nr:uncharacterized protein A1O7_03486 [Cladophialophora yegresii CBS 114405]EXJ63041.1 hypothetical protein A1O7_03486 [Cladophialophora yegresii CBS 114405]
MAIAPGGDNLADRERNPPPKPIPLEFPNYIPPRCESPLSQKHIKTVCRSLASIRRLADIQDSHLAHLNVQLDQDVPPSELIPSQGFEARPLLYDADLTAMLTELEADNEDAYREILRMPPLEGRKKPRLAYSRNFFASLEDMSRYWDDSKDNYYEVEASHAEDPGKDLEDAGDKSMEALESNEVEMTGISRNRQNVQRSNEQVVNGSPSGVDINTQTTELSARPKMKQVYKGNRLGNGEQMTAGTRVAALRNLLKMAVHKFNCRDYDVSPRERLRIQNINVPAASYNFCVAKLPAEPTLLRARMVEGPLMAVHCRNEVRFKSREGLLSPTSDFVGEKFDLFREIGGMLMLAKQRAREGQTLSKEPREDQWWAVKSRWGGGEMKWGQLASEVFEDDDPSWSVAERRLQLEKREKEEDERRKAEAAVATDLNNLKPEDLISGPPTPGSERPKKKKKSGAEGGASKDRSEYKDGRKLMYVPPLRRKWYQEWVKIRPNGPCWDEKIIYRTVGKVGEGEGNVGWDDVYMVSGANHHACILRMSVHDNYLEWLETGKASSVSRGGTSEKPGSRQDHVLYVSRSPWFDLFEIEQRKELLVAIWRILSWMNRKEVPKEQIEKMEELKQQQTEQLNGDREMEV